MKRVWEYITIDDDGPAAFRASVGVPGVSVGAGLAGRPGLELVGETRLVEEFCRLPVFCDPLTWPHSRFGPCNPAQLRRG
jgi:hypothetical protein